MTRILDVGLGTFFIAIGGLSALKTRGIRTHEFALALLMCGVGIGEFQTVVPGEWQSALSIVATLLMGTGAFALFNAEKRRRRAAGLLTLNQEYAPGALWLFVVVGAGILASIAPAFAPPYNHFGLYGAGAIMLIAGAAWVVARVRHHRSVASTQ